MTFFLCWFLHVCSVCSRRAVVLARACNGEADAVVLMVVPCFTFWFHHRARAICAPHWEVSPVLALQPSSSMTEHVFMSESTSLHWLYTGLHAPVLMATGVGVTSWCTDGLLGQLGARSRFREPGLWDRLLSDHFICSTSECGCSIREFSFAQRLLYVFRRLIFSVQWTTWSLRRRRGETHARLS